MKKIINHFIPYEDFIAMTVWPFIFVRSELKYLFDDVGENHENIHGRQQVEMLIVGLVLAGILALVGCGWWSLLALPVFFWWYLIEYLLRAIFGIGNAYRKLLFEQEAYANEKDFTYLKHRRPFAWIGYAARG